jgi:hypothetical protein
MISKDFSERDDVASRFPAKLKALKAKFWWRQKKYDMLPLAANVGCMPR